MNQNNKGNSHKGDDILAEKLSDATFPGAIVEFDPDEAEQVGAFAEDALNESDALASGIDLTNIG